MSLRRRLVAAVFIPTVLAQLALTMGHTFIPLYARDLGASMGSAALVSALLFLGQAITDLPGGYLVHRFGERRVMLAGTLLLLLSSALRTAARSLPVLSATVLLDGIGISLVWISRMAWMKREVRGRVRGFAMSFVGGSLRLGHIIGPLAGGFLAEHLGYRMLFISQGAVNAAAALLILAVLPAVPPVAGGYRESVGAARRTWQSRRRSIAAAALGIAGLTVLRASRGILFPLWGGRLGLGEGRIGVVMFAGAAADAALFWISGILMTRSGRKTAAVACTGGLALAIALLPLARGYPVLLGLSILAGIGNALGAGINLTVSGDLAPRSSPAAFLSIWRFAMGLAGFGGPAAAALVIGLAGAAAAPPTVAAAGFAGALLMAGFMSDTRTGQVSADTHT